MPRASRRRTPTGAPALWIASLAAVVAALAAGEWGASAAPHSFLALPVVRVLWATFAVGLQMAVLHHAVRRGEARAAALASLATRLGHPRDLPAMLDAGLAEAVRLLGAGAGAVRLLKGKGWLVLQAQYRLPATYQRERSRTVLDEQLRERKALREPIVLDAASTALPLDHFVTVPPDGSAILVPLLASGELKGFLALAFARPRRFYPGDLEALQAIGNQLGAAVAVNQVYEILFRESRTDPITGLASRRHFEELYRREISRAQRSLHPLSLAMIDVDDFKTINDRWGHVAGDRVLEAVGSLLQNTRVGDVVARYGGDEFVVLMPETRLEEAQQVVARLRKGLEQLNAGELFPFPVKLSIGVRQMSGLSANLLAEADAAMYEQKRARSARPSAPPRANIPFWRTGTDG